MVRAVIIDDSSNARSALKGDLEHYCPQVRVVSEADGVASGIKLILDYAPELVFLDIKMADGTGFDLLEKLKKENLKNMQVVFTTAYDQYAIQAFKYSAIDYLLKPVEPEELVLAVEKVEQKKSAGLPPNFDLLLENMKRKELAGRIALNSLEKVHIVPVSDIIRCESQRNYTLFYLSNKRQVLTTRTMKDYEEMLEPQGFIRVHHSHLINIQHLKEIIKTDGGYAIMDDEAQVPVSVRKKEQLLKVLGLK